MLLRLLIGIFTCLETISGQYNYDEVLGKSILFYEAQRSGKLPSTNRIPWRGDSALEDQGRNGEDLTGGWYDSGDFLKLGLPMAYSTTTLAWSILEFRTAYEAAGQYEYALDSIRWPLDYFIKCHVSDSEFYGQVGDAETDHSYWGRPEEMTMERSTLSFSYYFGRCDYSSYMFGGCDIMAETVAAFAAGSLVFRDSDPSYADTLLDHARRLYSFVYNQTVRHEASRDHADEFYPSTGPEDEFPWAAAWLYRATSEQYYLDRALESAIASDIAWAYDWDEKTVGYQLLLYTSAGQTAFLPPVESFLRDWLPGGTVQYTPLGLAWRVAYGPLRYAASAAFIALVAAKYNIMTTEAQDFARSQIHYILGDTGRSFVVGFGTNPPLQPHHRSSSCPDLPAECDWDEYYNPGPNYQTLNGALVGGPDHNDNYNDVRSDDVANKVACDFNAAFQGAVAGLRNL